MFQSLKNWWGKRRCHACNELKPKDEVSSFSNLCIPCREKDWELCREQARAHIAEKERIVAEAAHNERRKQIDLIKEALKEWYKESIEAEEAAKEKE